MASKQSTKIPIKKHTRVSVKGKVHDVKSHKRRKRKLGKKITYKPVGIFKVGHDDLGNFRGSKIDPLKTVKKTKVATPSKKVSRKRRVRYTNTNQVDVDYYKGLITEKQWLDLRKSLKGL
jgi:hypothetical protein